MIGRGSNERPSGSVSTVELVGPADIPVRSASGWLRFLLGFVILLVVLLGISQWDATGRFGLVILAVVALTGLAVERLLYRIDPRDALRRWGFDRPAGRTLWLALAIGALVQVVYPLTAIVTGATPSLRPGWPWLLVGIFAFHGLSEELVWRGYAYRRLRAGRSFRAAVLWTMPLMVLSHVPIVIRSGPVVGVAALLVAAITAIPLAYLYDTGRGTIWAPAVVHTAIDSFKIVAVPAAALTTFSLLLSAISIAVPLLVLMVRRRWLQPVRNEDAKRRPESGGQACVIPSSASLSNDSSLAALIHSAPQTFR